MLDSYHSCIEGNTWADVPQFTASLVGVDARPGSLPALILAPAGAEKEDHSPTETSPPVHTNNCQQNTDHRQREDASEWQAAFVMKWNNLFLTIFVFWLWSQCFIKEQLNSGSTSLYGGKNIAPLTVLHSSANYSIVLLWFKTHHDIIKYGALFLD